MTELPKEIFSKILTFIDYRDHRRVATDAVQEILDVGSINAELISQNIQLSNWLVASAHPFSAITGELTAAIAREERFYNGVITIDDWEKLEEQYYMLTYDELTSQYALWENQLEEQFTLNQEYEAELEEEYADYGYSNSEWSNRYTYHADRME